MKEERCGADGREGGQERSRKGPPAGGLLHARGCEEDGEASGGCSAGRQGSGGRADVVAGWEKPVKGARGQSCCVTLWWVTGRRVDRDRVGAMPIPPLQAGEDEPGPWGHGGQRRR